MSDIGYWIDAPEAHAHSVISEGRCRGPTFASALLASPADVQAPEAAIKAAAHTFVPPRKSFGMLFDDRALGGGGPIEATLKDRVLRSKTVSRREHLGERVTAQR